MRQIEFFAIYVALVGMVCSSAVSLAQTSLPMSYQRPDQYADPVRHQADLASFGIDSLANASDGSFRLILHDWHRKPAAITVDCVGRCQLHMVVNDGYGTYRQGQVETQRQTRITLAEYRRIRQSFEANNLVQIWETDRARDIAARESKSVEGICLHAPHYFLEQKLNGQHVVVYRYCVPNYRDLYGARDPMIDLARKYFPELTASAVVTAADVAALKN